MDSEVERRKAVMLMLLAATLWSTGGVMIKELNWSPVGILVGRNIFSSIVLLLYLRRFPTRWTRWKIIAAASHLLTSFLFISSTKLTTAANAIFLQYTAPVYIVVLAYWFLRERPSRVDWIAMVVILAGMALFFGDQLSTNGLYGNILAVLSGITMAFMTVALRAQKEGTPAESILIAQLAAAAFGFPVVLRESWTLQNTLIIVFLGVFQIGVAFILFTTAIKHLPAIQATLISTLEPVLNPVWVLLFVGEEPGLFAMFGAVVVLGGIAINAIGSSRAEPQPAPTP